MEVPGIAGQDVKPKIAGGRRGFFIAWFKNKCAKSVATKGGEALQQRGKPPLAFHKARIDNPSSPAVWKGILKYAKCFLADTCVKGVDPGPNWQMEGRKRQRRGEKVIIELE